MNIARPWLSTFYGVTSYCLLGSIAAAQEVYAQPLHDYRCKIERVQIADPANTVHLEFQEKDYVGKEFAVNRRTGVMTGAIRNAYITRPEVIDFGSAENSYKVVTTLRLEQGAGRGSNVYVLVVNEYVNGARKPFVFLENGDL